MCCEEWEMEDVCFCNCCLCGLLPEKDYKLKEFTQLFETILVEVDSVCYQIAQAFPVLCVPEVRDDILPMSLPGPVVQCVRSQYHLHHCLCFGNSNVLHADGFFWSPANGEYVSVTTQGLSSITVSFSVDIHLHLLLAYELKPICVSVCSVRICVYMGCGFLICIHLYKYSI